MTMKNLATEDKLSTLGGGAIVAILAYASFLGGDMDSIKIAFNIWVIASGSLLDALSTIQFGELSLGSATAFLLYRHKGKIPDLSADQPE